MNTLRILRKAINEPMTLFVLLLTFSAVCHHNNANEAAERIVAIAENFGEGVRKNETAPTRSHRPRHR